MRLLAATAGFGIVLGILSGVVPSLLARATSGARLTARTITVHRAAARLQHVLIGVEAALSLVLLVGAGLLGQTLLAMESVDPGFRPDRIVAVSLPLSGPETQPHLVRQLARDLTERLGGLPGVDAVTGANAVPFTGDVSSSSFEIEGREYAEDEKLPEAHRRQVLPGFHETLGIPIVAGRTILPSDREDTRSVIVVSRSLADRYFPNESPIGHVIVRDEGAAEIIGVVEDILHGSLTETRQSTFYYPFFQQPPNRFRLLLRSTLPVEALERSIRHVVAEVAPRVAVGRVQALDTYVRESTAPARYRAVLVAVFGGCSLLLAAIGIFGLTVRMVSARRRELGIRVALGAQRADITRTVMGREAWALGLGIAAGIGLAALSVRVLQAVLFGVSPYDPLTFAGAAVLLAAIGLAASYLPARATAVDPREALQAE